MRAPTDPAAIVRLLDLQPLPQEGGLFRRTHLDAYSSAILYLLVAPDVSALHRLTATETYHWHAGAPLRMLLLHPEPAPADATGGVTEVVLGPDLDAGQRPQVVVPAGTWQGSSPATPDADGVGWTLLGTTTAPPFDWTRFTLGDRSALTARYPRAAARIAVLTREDQAAGGCTSENWLPKGSV